MNRKDALRGDIHEALDPITGSTPDLLPGIVLRLRPVSRRGPLVAVARVGAVLGIGIVIAAVAFSLHRSRVTPPSVSTAPTAPIIAGPGASIAWLTSQQSSGGMYTEDIVTGIDAGGHVVGRINARDELRSPDGSHLYALSDAGVDVFSAADGHKERTIRLSPVSFGVPMLSPDGRYLAVVGGPPTTLQLVDLASGLVVASRSVDSPTSGTPVIVGAKAQHVYVLGGSSATKLAFDGNTLRVEQRGNTSPCNGLSLGGGNSAGGLPYRVLADGRTLVAFCPIDGRVTWFDLVTMSVTHEVVVGQNNPFWMSPVFSSDGNTLYLHEGGTGKLHAVDLVQRKIVTSAKVAAADPNPLAWLRSLLLSDAYAGGIPRTVALSPDGTWLYCIGAFGGPGGVTIVHLPELKVVARWLPNVSFDSIWVSADGQAIYLLGPGDQLRVLATDGSQVAKLALPANTFGFIVPTIP